jgi:5'-methylthioadenosine phosphorylase
MKRAIIGGTGFNAMTYLEAPRAQIIRTPFGSTTMYIGRYQDQEIVFLPRHGPEHNCLAHEINYRANIWGLRELGVERILGTSAIGSLNLEMQVGHLVVLDQLVDFTKHRQGTFNLGSVDFTYPYCSETRAVILQRAIALGIPVHARATYLTVEGPRYETAAEIALWHRLGMDVIGMTNGTEAALARELGLCYAVIGLVSDLAAGMQETPPDLEAHRQVVQDNLPRLRELALASLMALPTLHGCRCASQAAKPIR